MSEYSLFNAADDCLAPSIEEDSFEDSLLLNVLFQERLLLHEAYFFVSTLLTKHVKRAIGKPSLFEIASRRGLIIPAFRDPQTETLDQAYEGMRSRSVYGSSYFYELLHPEMQPLRDRIIGSVNMGLQTTKPFHWPTGQGYLGEGYHQVIRNLLQADEPPEYALYNEDRKQLFQRIWETSKRWRFDNVEDAAQLTRQRGARGLQRTDLFCSLGWSLGTC